uniref:Thioredoxin domain-containing protein 17 n=1 Tax=Soboliphyme baturini TaxID=241478 RepID=A0A183J3X6_9BILA
LRHDTFRIVLDRRKQTLADISGIIFKQVNTIDGLDYWIAKLQPQYQFIFVLYCGSRERDGLSWCPQCRALEEHLVEVAPTLPDDLVLIYVQVGTYEEWIDDKNAFRTSQSTHVQNVPTLVNFRTGQRLTEYECSNFANVDKFLYRLQVE